MPKLYKEGTYDDNQIANVVFVLSTNHDRQLADECVNKIKRKYPNYQTILVPMSENLESNA